jgi:hypothetical protein
MTVWYFDGWKCHDIGFENGRRPPVGMMYKEEEMDEYLNTEDTYRA